jgi:hypothetical protein
MIAPAMLEIVQATECGPRAHDRDESMRPKLQPCCDGNASAAQWTMYQAAPAVISRWK